MLRNECERGGAPRERAPIESLERSRPDRSISSRSVQQALYNVQSQLLSSENAYLRTLENFKIDMGLPPELNVKISDPMLDHLNLLDPELDLLQQQVAEALEALRQLRDRRAEQPAAAVLVVPNLPAAEDETSVAEDLLPWLEMSTLLKPKLDERLAAVHQDFEVLAAALPKRRQDCGNWPTAPRSAKPYIDPALFDVAAFDQRATARQEEFAALEKQLLTSWQVFEKLSTSDEIKEGKQLTDLTTALSEVSGQLLELSLIQAAARLESIRFEPVELTFEQALAIARPTGATG